MEKGQAHVQKSWYRVGCECSHGVAATAKPPRTSAQGEGSAVSVEVCTDGQSLATDISGEGAAIAHFTQTANIHTWTRRRLCHFSEPNPGGKILPASLEFEPLMWPCSQQ